MFKNILSLFLLFFVIAVTSQSFAITEPTEPANTKLKTDSTTIKSRQLINTSQEKPKVVNSNKSSKKKVSFWEEEAEEDSTSNSALSFNFIYYIIEKFKFQVE